MGMWQRERAAGCGLLTVFVMVAGTALAQAATLDCSALPPDKRARCEAVAACLTIADDVARASCVADPEAVARPPQVVTPATTTEAPVVVAPAPRPDVAPAPAAQPAPSPAVRETPPRLESRPVAEKPAEPATSAPASAPAQAAVARPPLEPPPEDSTRFQIPKSFTATIVEVWPLVRGRVLVGLGNGLLFEGVGEASAFRNGRPVDVAENAGVFSDSYLVTVSSGRTFELKRVRCETDRDRDTRRKCASFADVVGERY